MPCGLCGLFLRCPFYLLTGACYQIPTSSEAKTCQQGVLSKTNQLSKFMCTFLPPYFEATYRIEYLKTIPRDSHMTNIPGRTFPT
ncbi:hypothetical protein BU16DRAFT_145966 [Lophium mytilinum]|uniref:Secreted protein n=1 Tax=Lophium mytilinum TaxID=390894 RepID=A0A6A6QCL3_9PEZI|nr:hypothetical protein BU16DRAFT_145966 [Lophium mytilinum]